MQSWIRTDAEAETLILGHLMQRTDSLEKTLMLGKIEGRRRGQGWDGWMASPTRWAWVWASSRIWWWTGKPGVLQSMGSQRVGHDWETELMQTFLLRKKAMASLDSILKTRNSTLLTKIHIVKAMVSPVVMYGCDSWTIKKAENWRIDAFELWCCKRLLRVPWTARRSNQSILKEINPWVFIGRTDAAPEATILWPPDVKRQLLGKDLDV